jgi:Na+-transporting NADH:ubiquinone oxidoreductase subunit A
MTLFRIKRGLDLPLPGGLDSPDLVRLPEPTRVALMPPQSWGIKVQLLAQEGQRVQVGTPLYCDRRDPRVVYAASAAGVLERIVRGEKRAVLAVVVHADNFDEQAPRPHLEPARAARAEIVEALAASGLWPALRQRPFDRVAHSDDVPRAIFVTAMDTEPLAPSPREAVRGREEHFRAGLEALARLAEKGVRLCSSAEEDWSDLRARGGQPVAGVEAHQFRGPHPAGLPGTHIHLLDPVGAKRKVWHVAAQDVADIGEFFATGRIPTARRVAVVGGSALSGRTAQPGSVDGWLGRWDRQVTLLSDETEREFLGWSVPLGRRWSATNVYPGKFLGARRLRFDTDLNGSPRAIVPIGAWERLMPLDVLPTQLIKALASDDLEGAERLGALELAEEDLALCEYVDQSKTPVTTLLRQMLARIEKEG